MAPSVTIKMACFPLRQYPELRGNGKCGILTVRSVGPDSAPGSQPLRLWSSPATRTTGLHPCPALSLPPSASGGLIATGPSSPAPGSPSLHLPPPRAWLPQPQPSTPARCLPPSPPPVSPSPAPDVGGEGGGGPDDSQCCDAVPQHTATFTHRQGTGRRPPLAAPRPRSWASLAARV